MKKATVKDEEGFLGAYPHFLPSYHLPFPTTNLETQPVTKEEPVWESFSEAEEAPRAKSVKQPSSTAGSSGGGGGGGSASVKPKKGQQARGSIAHFFAKK